MKKKEDFFPKRITILDKIKNAFRKLSGYKEAVDKEPEYNDFGMYVIDTKPTIKKYSEIELMKIAEVEEKLKKALEENENVGKLVSGISKAEAELLLEWVAQNAKKGFEKEAKGDITDRSLTGYCGLGQGITGFTLQSMGLNPNITNVNPTLTDNSGRHAFLTVDIPIQENNSEVENLLYLVDTTYRQFFIRENRALGEEEHIQDKRFGNKVYPMEGYWLMNLPGGKEFAERILSQGFAEMTEENAKLYGDSFVLAWKERANKFAVPSREECISGITGTDYIKNMKAPENFEEIDYSRSEFDNWGINLDTPYMRKIAMRISTQKVSAIDNNKTDEKEKIIDGESIEEY